MLDAKGAGGSYSGTNWAAMSVMDMWLAVGNQDTTAHWRLLTGWRRSYELTLQHMTQVRSYRDRLAAVWPPDRSPASAAYLARLDVLIAHLEETYDAAVTNHRAFNGATLALGSARAELAKVVDEYLANEGKLAAFERERAERSSRGLQRGRELPRPVADGRQAELEDRARKIMYALSTELAQATTQIVKPAEYDPAAQVDGGTTEGNRSRYTAPPITPVIPFTPQSSSFDNISSAGRIDSIEAAMGDAKRLPGLVLGGIAPPTMTPPSSSVAPPDSEHSPVRAVAHPGQILGPPLATPRSIPSPQGAGGRSSGDLTRPEARAATGTTRLLPPGGIIGGTPGTGLSQPATGPRPTSTVNPVGGLIGPGNRSAQGSPVAMRTGTKKSQNDERLWDTDNPWETVKGVSPIVLPPSEQRVDPGPAIGLR